MPWVKTYLDDKTHQQVLNVRDELDSNMTEAVRHVINRGLENE